MTNDNRVIFGPGVSMSTCDVKLIDDSEYELSEEFELVLSDTSENARMGDVSVAKVVIDGPNDASTVSLGNATFTFSEDAGMNLPLTAVSLFVCQESYSCSPAPFSKKMTHFNLLLCFTEKCYKSLNIEYKISIWNGKFCYSCVVLNNPRN